MPSFNFTKCPKEGYTCEINFFIFYFNLIIFMFSFIF